MRTLRIPVVILFFLLPFSPQKSSAQIWKNILKSSGSGGEPSSTEIISAIKQALEKGTGESAGRLAAQNGFFGNAAVKLLFPPEAKRAEQTLRGLGLNKLCDNVILSLNRAAEDAAKEAAPIFVSAIRQMTVKDASGILLGADTAATGYFKRTTRAELAKKFAPVIDASLAKVGATRYWGEVMTRYNKIPFGQKINPDLSAYATNKAIEGLFTEIAKEELKIRQQIGARNTPLLQKVFSYADKKKE
ncbi:MAG: DUF4197 domain-containing protein [Mucilaginibacter polytrichastri]|nr:DUF4197 domain-containing protein [Mucilaginibacter polytrichastri]